jgi:phosphatidylglycerophosphate synthase
MMLTLPNLLTLSRILAVPILVFLLWKPAPYDYLITFVLYCVVGITDYFDGYLARAQDRSPGSRQFLRPDRRQDHGRGGPRHADDGQPQGRWRRPSSRTGASHSALIILLREIMVSGPARIPRRHEGAGARQCASQVEETTFQLVALGALIFGGAFPGEPWIHWVGIGSLWAAAALTLVTGWDYLRIGLRHMD